MIKIMKPIYAVWWKDITGREYIDSNEMRESPLIEFVSVGFKIGTFKDGKISYIRLANRVKISDHGEPADEIIDIPVCCITNIKRLKE